MEEKKQENKILTIVELYLKSQERPIRFETDWFYINEAELNDPRKPFIKIEDNFYRKDDILKIIKAGTKEVLVGAENENPVF